MSRTAVVNFGTNWIMQLDDRPGVLGWTCRFEIDADGHPRCYHPDGSPPGLDYLANATSDSKKYIQGKNDPAPGFYVSMTALADGMLSVSNPNKYVHAGEIPYIVLPGKPKFSDKQTLGDLGLVFNNKTGKMSWAIYADIGPANKIGEGSIALADSLGINSNPRTGGESQEVIAMIYFPGSKIGWPRPSEELAAKAWQLFQDWGGYDSAKQLLPQINWDQFPSQAPEPLAS